MNHLVMQSQTILGRARGEQPANTAESKALGTLRFCSAERPSASGSLSTRHLMCPAWRPGLSLYFYACRACDLHLSSHL